jgi:hypothetical protein
MARQEPDEWILLSTCTARMGELHRIYVSYRGYAQRDLESAICAGRATLRGQRLGSTHCSSELIGEPITARHRLDLIHNSLSERRPGPYGDNVLFRNVEMNWTGIKEYLRLRAAEQWPSFGENVEKNRGASGPTPNAQQRLKGPSRGPTQGTTGYRALDRKLFPRITKLLKSGKVRSVHDAAMHLADKIAGSGTPENKAKRLSALYRKEHVATGAETV